MFSFPSPGTQDLLRGPIAGWHVSQMLFSAREHQASDWLDLAEGRLRLDRLNRNGGSETFFPWARHPARKACAGTSVRPFLARAKKVSPPPSSAALRP
jgi:hypothetical protein